MVDIYNTTATAGLASMSNWLPMLGVILVATIGIGILLMAFSTNYFKRFFKLFGLIGRSLFYFIKGALTVVAGYLIYYLGDLLGKTASQIPFEWIVCGIVFYVGCSVLGWIVTKVWRKIKINYKNLRRVK